MDALTYILKLAVELFHGDRTSAEEWVQKQILALGNRRPFDLARSAKELQQLEDLIGRIRHGIVS